MSAPSDRPELCDACAGKGLYWEFAPATCPCINADYAGNGSCAERIALYDSGARSLARKIRGLPEWQGVDWTFVDRIGAVMASRPDAPFPDRDQEKALLAIRKLLTELDP